MTPQGAQKEQAPRKEAVVTGAERRYTTVDALITSLLTREQFDRFRAGGVNAVNYTSAYFMHDFEPALADLAALHEHLQTLSDCYRIVRSVDDIAAAKREGRVGVIMGLQNGKPIRDRVENVRLLHALGVRIIQLTYNERNFIGDGCTEPGNAGISEVGKAIIKEMNRVGVLIDLSHCGARTTREAIDISEAPVAITHANPIVLNPNPRNKPDETLKALAARGGVLGCCVWSPLAAIPGKGRPTTRTFADLIDYSVNLMGIDHVGFGTDHGEGVYTREQWEQKWGPKGLYPQVTGNVGPWFGFETRYADGLHSAALLGNLAEELSRRGYKDEDVAKVMGGNFLRLFSTIWR